MSAKGFSALGALQQEQEGNESFRLCFGCTRLAELMRRHQKPNKILPQRAAFIVLRVPSWCLLLKNPNNTTSQRNLAAFDSVRDVNT